jgi:hypothetical protein
MDTTTESTTTETAKTTKKNVHALVQAAGAPIGAVSFATKKELAKYLSQHPEETCIVAFKGKPLTLVEKKAYSFS